MSLPDKQSESDDRGVPIDQVGISGLRLPLVFDDRLVRQSGVAEVDVTVGLPAGVRGTHMSRMVRLAADELQLLDPEDFPRVLKIGANALSVDEIKVVVSLPFATMVTAPITGRRDWQAHDLKLIGQLRSGLTTLDVTVTSDVTSLCPCSRAISDYGAHNQRSRVSVTTRGEGDRVYPVRIGQLAEMIRSSASCPVYPFVRRPDERAITMTAYDNPVFVEDIVRNLSIRCDELGVPHRIEARNLESIHSHDAVALINRL